MLCRILIATDDAHVYQCVSLSRSLTALGHIARVSAGDSVYDDLADSWDVLLVAGSSHADGSQMTPGAAIRRLARHTQDMLVIGLLDAGKSWSLTRSDILAAGARGCLRLDAAPSEIDAAVRAYARRYYRLPLSGQLTIGNIVVDTMTGTVTVGGEDVDVDGDAYRLLERLALAGDGVPIKSIKLHQRIHGDCVSFASDELKRAIGYENITRTKRGYALHSQPQASATQPGPKPEPKPEPKAKPEPMQDTRSALDILLQSPECARSVNRPRQPKVEKTISEKAALPRKVRAPKAAVEPLQVEVAVEPPAPIRVVVPFALVPVSQSYRGKKQEGPPVGQMSLFDFEPPPPAYVPPALRRGRPKSGLADYRLAAAA